MRSADLKSLFELGDATASERQALALMSQQWPWPRSVYALILDRLFAAGREGRGFRPALSHAE